MPSPVTILGLVAAACTTLCYVPQVKKAWQSGSTGDLSFKMLSLLAAGVALWLAYGMLKGDAALIVANAVTLVLVGVLAVLRFREKQREKTAE